MIVCVYMYYCKQGNIPLVSFSSLLPSSSADEFFKRLCEFHCVKLSFFKHNYIWAKLFAIVEGQKLHLAKITL